MGQTDVRMRVRVRALNIVVMLMRVMFVMCMQMLVGLIVDMAVLVPLGDRQPHAGTHE